jgi:hypothetical protein
VHDEDRARGPEPEEEALQQPEAPEEELPAPLETGHYVTYPWEGK